MRKILLLIVMPVLVACGSTAIPESSPTNALNQPRFNSPMPTPAPPLTPTICPSTQNPIRTPLQALPPSQGACPP